MPQNKLSLREKIKQKSNTMQAQSFMKKFHEMKKKGK